MEDITLSQCLKGAWRDAAHALRRMPILFIVAFVLILATGVAGYEGQFSALGSGGSLPMTNPGSAEGVGIGRSLASLGLTLLQSLVAAVLAVQVIRFAMAANTGAVTKSGTAAGDAANAFDASVAPSVRLWDAGIRRYFVLCLAVLAAYAGVLIALVIAWIGLRLAGLPTGTSMAAGATLAILAACGVSYVSARLALLFPHTAAGGQLQWRAAWEDSRGHFWAIASTAVVAILPIVTVALVIAMVVGMLATPDSIDSMTFGLLVMQSIVTLLYTATTATCSVWLYKKYGTILRASLG
jgi:hypothetical protein